MPFDDINQLGQAIQRRAAAQNGLAKLTALAASGDLILSVRSTVPLTEGFDLPITQAALTQLLNQQVTAAEAALTAAGVAIPAPPSQPVTVGASLSTVAGAASTVSGAAR